MPIHLSSRSSAPRRSLRASLAGSFWVADALVIALLVFFVALGAVDVFEAPGFAIALGILVGLYALHVLALARGRGGLGPEGRRDRERRGF